MNPRRKDLIQHILRGEVGDLQHILQVVHITHSNLPINRNQKTMTTAMEE